MIIEYDYIWSYLVIIVMYKVGIGSYFNRCEELNIVIINKVECIFIYFI